MDSSATDTPSLEIPRQAGAPRVAIVGSGFSGLCLGIHLLKEGIRSFRIYEKAAGLGGTWRENTYPGAACDIASFAYCFSFEQKTDWSRKWAPQEEILDYMDFCAAKHGLDPHLRYRTEIAGAAWDDAACVWRIRTADGQEVEAEILVSCVGQLHHPMVPSIEGMEDYRGRLFHSARWDHGFDCAGKDIAVIGNAASAVQLVPPVARMARRLHVFQRSANWMFPRGDRAYTPTEKERFARSPWTARLYRWLIWFAQELWYPVFRRNALLTPMWERFAVRHMESIVQDPAMRKALLPDYPIGARRILVSDDYYQTLVRDNVELVTGGVDRLTADGVVGRDGVERKVDAVILATGFRTTDFLAPMKITGRDGLHLDEAWKDGARAHLGMTVAGFPNLFLMYGPNTNLGHNSIIFMIECQTGYILQLLRAMRSRGFASLEVKAEVMEDYDRGLQAELARTAWAAVDKSWYKNAAGRITNNWAGTTTRYWWRTRKARLEDFRGGLAVPPSVRTTAPSHPGTGA